MSSRSKKPQPQAKDPLAPVVAELLELLGEDASREGLKRTPQRVADALRFLTSGYQTDPEALIRKAVFRERYSEMVVARDIEFYSLCEHHLIPFYGRCHVGYIPRQKIVGLSKIPRVVNAFSRRLQVQERLTVEIAECLQKSLEPLGVGVVMEAKHLCMMMRGVEKENSVVITSCLLGGLRNDPKTREEFLRLINGKGGV